MGLFDSASGALFGEADAGKAVGGSQALPSFETALEWLTFFPQLQQGIAMATALGQSPQDFFKEAVVTNPLKKDGINDDMGIIKIGKTAFDTTKFAGIMQQGYQTLQTKGIGFFEDTFDKLSNVPALASTFQEAMGNVNLTPTYKAGLDSLAGAVLGNAVQSGFLADPVKQANALGPVAHQKAALEWSIHKNSLGQAIGMSGGNFLPGLSPIAGLGVPSMQSFVNPAMGFALGLSGQNTQTSIANAGFKSQANLFNQNQANEFGGAVIGGTAAGFAPSGSSLSAFLSTPGNA